MKTLPSMSRLSMRRMLLRAPSATTSQSVASWYTPSGVSTCSVAPCPSGLTEMTLLRNRRSRLGSSWARLISNSSR